MINAKSFAYVFGAVYAVVGLLGFAVTGLSGFAAPQGDTLILFGINPLHNVVHVLIGVALLGAAASGPAAARLWTGIVGGVLGLVGLLGFFIVGTPLNILALNLPDNLLHLATAVVAFLVLARSPQPASA